ncbi:MAG: DUF6438 domain-containing protein [Candidatus Promineifilaceae bacterium]
MHHDKEVVVSRSSRVFAQIVESSVQTTDILCPNCGKNLDELFEHLPDTEITYKSYWFAKVLEIVSSKKIRFFLLTGLLIFIVFSNRVHLINLYDTTPPQNVIITIERTMCFGFCPDYRLSIYGNGKVVYEGRYYVRVEGTRTTYIPKRKVRELVSEFERIGFYNFDDNYAIGVTDMPSVLITLNLEGRSKTIDIYGGGAPDEVMNLILQIEETVKVSHWVGEIQ